MTEEPLEGQSKTPPVEELAGFELEADPLFIRRVSRAIERRKTTASIADLSSRGLMLVVLEYMDLVAGMLSPSENDRKRSR